MNVQIQLEVGVEAASTGWGAFTEDSVGAVNVLNAGEGGCTQKMDTLVKVCHVMNTFECWRMPGWMLTRAFRVAFAGAMGMTFSDVHRQYRRPKGGRTSA